MHDIQELTKEAEHLPTFADTEIAAHYVAVRDELLRRGSDPWTIDNINRILHANAVMLGDRAPALPEGTEATAAPNFSLGFGARYVWVHLDVRLFSIGDRSPRVHTYTLCDVFLFLPFLCWTET